MRNINHVIRAQRVLSPGGVTAPKALSAALIVTFVLAGAAFAQTVQEVLDLNPIDQIVDTHNLELKGARNIAIFKIGERTYAAVTGYYDDGVQILDLTDPANIEASGQITDTSRLELRGPRGITTSKIGDGTYAAVAGHKDHGVQILDLTDPANIRASGRITDDDVRELEGPADIATFKKDGRTYAAVAATDDNGVQILDLTNPSEPEWSGQIPDNPDLVLFAATGITTFKIGERTYAAVAALLDDGIQILDLTDPANIRAAGQITDSDIRELDGALDVDPFEIGGHTYLAVAAHDDNGVQIIHLTGESRLNRPPTADASPDQTVQEGSSVTLSGTASDPDGDNLSYQWTHDRDDLGVSLDDTAALSTTFTALQVDSDAAITFTLTATDEHGAQGSDTVAVTVQDVPSDPPQENTVVLEPPEQRGSRDIGTITLVSSRPGTIQASWEAPTENPANYRISWGKAGENFRTWTDPSCNAFPTEPSYTIAGLEGGEEYKVKVRASYSGTAGDWSGQATITVADVAASKPVVPSLTFGLGANFPNPFNPDT